MSDPKAEESLRKRFIKQRTPGNANFFDKLVEHMAPGANDPCIEMYFNYAMSTNDRGRHAADVLEKFVDLKNAMFLDIGCAYAGFLVAFAERGAKVHGIELMPNTAELARLNLKDAGLDVEVMYRDATRLGDVIEMANRMNVITCNDVIEHVENPLSLATNIALLLAPGGIAYLEIPNRNHPRFVISDGHYGLFGITLLDYLDAKEYYGHQMPDAPYYTQFYLDLDQCNSVFQHAGMTLEVLRGTFDGVTVETTLADVEKLEKDAERLLQAVPKPMLERISKRLAEYLRTIHATPLSSEAQRQEFLLRYGPGFWQVIARKNDSPGSIKTQPHPPSRRGLCSRAVRSAARRIKNLAK